MRRIRTSFAGRLLAAVLVLVLLPALILGVVLFTQARNTSMDAELDRIETTSGDLATRMDEYVLAQRDIARYAASSAEVRDFIQGPRDAAATSQVDAWLRDGPFSSDAVADAFILDAQGTCIASTNPSFVGESYGFRSYYQEAVTGSDAISDWTIGSTSGKPGIYLASPIRGEFEEVAGVLVFKLETSAVDDLVAQAFGTGAKAVVMNRMGVVLSAYDDAFVYSTVDGLTSQEAARVAATRQFADEPLPSLGLSTLREDLEGVLPGRTTISREYSIDGEARIAALTGTRGTPWAVAVVAPLRDIEAASAPVPVITGGVIALVLLYAALATAYLSRFVVRPIRELADGSQRLAAGDLTVQVAVRGDDEVAHLATAFNAMAAEIRGNTERLEGEVRRRTAELEEANRAITELSVTDSLTGCSNRHFLDLQLPRELDRAGRYARRLSVVMCDIDYFKAVNDEYGHAVGDAVLRAVGGYLNTHRRAPDWVARFGGEEFVIVLPETDLHDACEIAERTRAGIAALTVQAGGASTSVTASFGVSTFRMGQDETAQTLLHRSDEAMYRAKQGGRDRVEAEPTGTGPTGG
jgi:diguanylate cyclase (GGDEF)-like protein